MDRLAKIFIVDDDQNLVFILKEFLRSINNHIIDCAFNGEEAIQKLKNFTEFPDLILMDHRMPVKNGIETSKVILGDYPQTKIIFLSADYTVREKALEIGAKAFVEKPFSFEKLKIIIEKVLAN